jgi:hypothetical protein
MTMKKIMILLMILAISIAFIQTAIAQTSQSQTVTVAVNSVYLMSVSGSPGNLTITAGAAGTDALTPVTDASTTYSITQNNGGTVKITAYLNTALPAGYTLYLTMASAKGTSAGAVDISTKLSGSAATIVSNIANGADANKTITYQFAANASAGTLSSTAKTVTLTLTN